MDIFAKRIRRIDDFYHFWAVILIVSFGLKFNREQSLIIEIKFNQGLFLIIYVNLHIWYFDSACLRRIEILVALYLKKEVELASDLRSVWTVYDNLIIIGFI